MYVDLGIEYRPSVDEPRELVIGSHISRHEGCGGLCHRHLACLGDQLS
jgi:hypothetical protein